MILLDVNILVTAHRADAEQHREIKGWLQSVLREPPGVAVSELALSGCLRIVTHPKVFKKPTPAASGLGFSGRFSFPGAGSSSGTWHGSLGNFRRSLP